MQLKIKFQCRELLLPIAYRQIVQGMLYRQLEQQPDYAKWLHDAGNIYDRRSFKQFTFSELSGNYCFFQDLKQLCFHNSIHLEVRSADPRFIQLLLISLSEGKRVELNHQIVEVSSVRLENYQISENEIMIRTLTPVAAHITEQGTNYQRWYGPEEPEFYRQVVHNAERRYLSFYTGQSCGELHFAPAEHGGFHKVVTSYKHCIINAWNGNFVLTGNPQLLNFLYDSGLGERNAQGFGMFRVLSEKE